MGLVRKVSKWVYTTIKNQDLFPQSVQMTYKGDSEYRTFHSGLISTITKLFMAYYAINLVYKMVQNQNSSKNVNTVVEDITNDQTKHYIGKSTFGITIQFRGNQRDTLKDPTYFEIFIGQDSYSQEGTYYIEERNIKQIDLKNCTNIFPMSDEEFKLLKLDEALCLANDDYYIQGNSRSIQWNEISVNILP